MLSSAGQFSKVLGYNWVKVEGNTTLLRDTQSLKAISPNDTSPSGNRISTSDIQPSKTKLFILLIPLNKNSCESDVQPAKALLAIYFTLPAITAVVISHIEKASIPILSTPSGISNLLNFVFPS